MITKLAIWWLRKRKRSVMIGYEVIEGAIKARNNNALLYDNTLIGVSYQDSDGKSFNIPEGKFDYKRVKEAGANG
ncbi:hypothetical protein ABH16_04685 [Bacillus altitudinis]|uniref:hypothetical protein n=1 Tax=Bacillus altitudinis TaxID=293387 RepID=UPI0009384F21|nr:hypothetical protein [Bacillus altitudinis]APP15618.1 hypothetical protein BS467_07665 [Bacillus altitudinis]MBG9901825.1 hypothetical protein [Bacillus altitudinis]